MSTWEELKDLGNNQFKQGNYNQAISIYTDAIKQYPEQDVLYANRALCYKSIGNFRNAILDLEKSLGINPKSVKNLKRKAEYCLSIGNFSEAINCFHKCSNFEPRESSHKTDITLANNYLNNFNEVLKEFHKENYSKSEELSKVLLKVCVGFKELKVIYMESLIHNNKLQEASDYWGKLGDNDRVDDEFLYIICKIFYYEGNYDKAKTFMKKLLSKVNDNHKYNKLYQNIVSIEKEKENANSLFKAGKYTEAIVAYTTILNMDTANKVFNSTIIANRALCYDKLGKTIEALSDMNTSLSWNDKYTKGFLRRANLNMKLSNFEQAKYDFKRVSDLEPSNQEAKKGFQDAQKQEKAAKKKDYYKVLDLSRDANESQIRKAYKVLAQKWHPDKNSQSDTQKEQAEKRFKEITEAYEVLSDPKKKQMFDSGVDPNDAESGGYSGSNVNPHDIFNMFFAGGGFPGGHGGHGHGDDDFGGHPFGSFFSTGGGGGRGGRGQTFTFSFK